ncbi:MAG TPA: hypothetical protein VF030_05925 [Solirubrobacterales bacterium]
MNQHRISLAGILAVALMAFAGTASATTLTSPAGTAYTGTIKLAAENGHIKILWPLNLNIQCASTIEGAVESHGGGNPAVVDISSLTFSGCTNGYGLAVLADGVLEIHGNHVVTSSGTKLTLTTPLGFNCIYETTATEIAGLTDSSQTAGNATLDIYAKALPRTGHSAFCGASAEVNGNYRMSTPAYLEVD